MRLHRLAAIAVLASLISGCSSLQSNISPEQRYVLHAPVTQPHGAAVAATLQLLRPVAQPGLDTDRIALVQPGNRLDYFAGGRWSGPLERVVESMLVQTLRGSGRFAQISHDGAGMGADFVLAVTLRRFEADYAAEGGAPMARVQLECTLSSRRDHRQLAGFDIVTEAPAGANRLGSVVAALEAAGQEAARQLADKAAEIAAGR
jgi:cholesterol transport system auxiliary component